MGKPILIIDAVLQDPTELLSAMMSLMDHGADLVYCQRTSGTSFKRATATAFYQILRRLVDFDVPSDTGDFCLMSRRALAILNAMPEQHRFIRGMVSWIGMDQCALLYGRQERFASHTKYPLRRMIKFALDAITSFSIRPRPDQGNVDRTTTHTP